MFAELKTDKFSNPYDFDMTYENLCNKHVKDFYDELWETDDFLDEDVTKAFTHAVQELDIAKAAGNNVRMNHIKRACKDLENYLKATNCLAQEYRSTIVNPRDHTDTYNMWDKDAKRLIAAMASFKEYNIDVLVTDVIWRRYCPDDQIDEVPGFCPNYRELYEQIGDEALFCEGDINRAKLWYLLMPIDWECYYDEADSELNNEQLLIKRKEEWWANFVKNIEKIFSLSDEDMVHTNIIGIENHLDVSDSCRELLREYLDAWGGYVGGYDESDSEKIWLAAKKFAERVKAELANYDGSLSDKKTLRTEAMLAWIIINQSKYYYILDKASSNIENISDEEVGQIETLLTEGSLSVDKVLPIQKCFYENYEENALLEDKKKLIVSVLYLLKAVQDCDKILFVLNCGPTSEKVAYYTKQDTLMKMLPDTADFNENVGKLAVMHIAYMNDPNEGKVLKQWIFNNAEEIRNGRKRADYPYVFIKCFTTLIDDLPMWEMYGDHAQGCCIVIDMKKVMKEEKRVIPMYNVCYLRKDDRNSFEIDGRDNISISEGGIAIIKEVINDLSVIQGRFIRDDLYQETMNNLMSRITYLFKNADYSHECEKRIIYSTMSGINSKRIRHTIVKEGNSMPMLYVLSDMRVCIDEVILGPKYKDAPWKLPYLQESIQKMYKEIGINDSVKISYSSIEYR